MTNKRLLKLRDCGQSLWMDYLNREIIESGELQNNVVAGWLRGITSNPSIFEKAIRGNQLYEKDIEKGIRNGWSTEQIYQSLAFEDIRKACAILHMVYHETEGADGYVSIEVSPHLARDTEGTIEEALRFYRSVERDNVMIKIPGTPEGFPAVEQVTARGVNVNITLLFSVESYENAAWAYIRGLEERVSNSQPIDHIASVASFFLSRIDTKVDDRIDKRIKSIGTDDLTKKARLQNLKGKIAIANAKIAYQKHQEILASDRWQALAQKGANVQRLLWASTSTKNPDYSDVMYVDELVAPNTVNTMPPNTIAACADHCNPVPNRIETDVAGAQQLFTSLDEPDINIHIDTVMDELLEEGIQKFVQPYNSLMQSLDEKVAQLSAA